MQRMGACSRQPTAEPRDRHDVHPREAKRKAGDHGDPPDLNGCFAAVVSCGRERKGRGGRDEQEVNKKLFQPHDEAVVGN